MYNTNDLVKLIKKAAVDAVNASKPANMLFGTVISTSPLKIKVDQKLTLGQAQLVLSENLTDRSVSILIDGVQQTATIRNALKKGDEVIMMQLSGGQKYIVIDRIGKG